MERRELVRRYAQLQANRDHEGTARFLAEFPQLLRDPSWPVSKMTGHAMTGETAFLRVLLDAGVSPDIQGDSGNDRPLVGAAGFGHIDVVRLLLERGAAVNWSWRGAAYHSTALVSAILKGHDEIARMLIDAGAVLDAIDPAGATPLAWAVRLGRHEVAAYLRSKGAVMPEDAPGYVPPPPPDPMGEYITSTGAFADGEVACSGGVAVLCGMGPTRDDGDYLAVTRGMSDRPMTTPAGGEAYARAELAVFMLDGSFDASDWPSLNQMWIADWMLRVAAWPFANNTWLGGKWTIISNEDPPRPLSEFTAMTCWLLLAEKEPLVRCDLPDGRSVVFYTMMAIHTAERDLALRDGLVALLEKFAEHDVPVHLDPARTSVV